MGEKEISNNTRITGRVAQEDNINAVKVLSSIVKTTLGPRGMDKLLLDANGNITVTNDGVTILEEMQIMHPAAKLIAETAKTQEKEIGDGTTTVTILAGELLKNAQKLIEKSIHPTIIIKGYNMAQRKAQEILYQNSIKIDNTELLEKVAQTAMTGKGAENYREHLSKIIVEAVEIGKKKENIIFAGITGCSVNESRIVRGVILNKEIPDEKMPKMIEKAKIGLLGINMDIQTPEADTRINLESFDEMQSFQEEEDKKFKEYAKKIINSGVNVVFCNKSINEKVFYYLGKEGIIAIRNVNKYDIEMLSKTTGAAIVSNFEDFREENFGFAELVKEERYSDDDVRIFVETEKNPEAVTILIYASTEHILQEIKRAMTDGLGDVLATKDGRIVAGGGAIEIEVAKELRKYGQTLKGREQLAVESFAAALESIPETLAENAGLDPISILAALKQKHDINEKSKGLNLLNDAIEDMLEAGIIEPLKIKTQAIDSATEVATMILRIDDNLLAKEKN